MATKKIAPSAVASTLANVTRKGPPPPPAKIAPKAPPAAAANKGKAPKAITAGGPPPPAGKASTALATTAPAPKGKAPGPNHDAALMKQIEASQAQIAALTAKLASVDAKRASMFATEETAAAEGEKLPKGDWRKPYVGYVVGIARFSEKKGELVVDSNKPSVPMLLVRPSDDMRGGTAARNAGCIGLTSALRDDGTWDLGVSVFLTEDEFNAVYTG